MNESSVSKGRFDISASKIITYIAILIIIREAIIYFGSSIDHAVLHGIVDLIIATVLFILVQIVDLKKVKIPYRWWILLIIGLVLLLMTILLRFVFLSPVGSYLGATLVLLASLIEFLSLKKTYSASKLTILIGAGIAVYECVMLFLNGGMLIVNGVFGIIFVLILILAWWNKVDIKIPFSWWVILTVGFVIFTYISPFYLGVAGTVIFVGLFLMLMDY
jgi:hypothetical protein